VPTTKVRRIVWHTRRDTDVVQSERSSWRAATCVHTLFKRGCPCELSQSSLSINSSSPLFSLLFPQVEQPRVFKGNVATAGIAFAMSAGLAFSHMTSTHARLSVCVALATVYLQRRDERRASHSEPLPETRSEDSEGDDGKADAASVLKMFDVHRPTE
jgi:hypothetical protein